MALLLYEPFIGRSVVRAAMLVPWAMPTVVTSKMFGWLFDGQYGLVNYLLRSAGLIDENINWLRLGRPRAGHHHRRRRLEDDAVHGAAAAGRAADRAALADRGGADGRRQGLADLLVSCACRC